MAGSSRWQPTRSVSEGSVGQAFQPGSSAAAHACRSLRRPLTHPFQDLIECRLESRPVGVLAAAADVDALVRAEHRGPVAAELAAEPRAGRELALSRVAEAGLEGHRILLLVAGKLLGEHFRGDLVGLADG